MTTVTSPAFTTQERANLRELWFTRCPVPTATGLAYKLGWLDTEFAKDGIRIATLQDNRELAHQHYDHRLPTLIREGGSLLALAARAQGAPTRLVGLTWIDEHQVILVRPGSHISEPHHLRGARVALPAFIEADNPLHVRGSSIARGMTLHGIKGALSLAGLTLDDVRFVEVESGRRAPSGPRSARGLQGLWAGLTHLIDGKVDAVYVKGASAVDAAREIGAVVGIDLDRYPDKRTRVNNGTPRPITVHERLLEEHFDLVVRFLAQTLRAAEWAKSNLAGVREILKEEARSGDEGVAAAYRDDFHKSLHPDLSKERLDLFRIQKNFMLIHGLLDRDFDLDAWVDPRPLQAAWQLLRSAH
jgi:ABC-type nitrate/sulfonate/bicarbonate transport system substrate-binding protein